MQYVSPAVVVPPVVTAVVGVIQALHFWGPESPFWTWKSCSRGTRFAYFLSICVFVGYLIAISALCAVWYQRPSQFILQWLLECSWVNGLSIEVRNTF